MINDDLFFSISWSSHQRLRHTTSTSWSSQSRTQSLHLQPSPTVTNASPAINLTPTHSPFQSQPLTLVHRHKTPLTHSHSPPSPVHEYSASHPRSTAMKSSSTLLFALVVLAATVSARPIPASQPGSSASSVIFTKPHPDLPPHSTSDSDTSSKPSSIKEPETRRASRIVETLRGVNRYTLPMTDSRVDAQGTLPAPEPAVSALTSTGKKTHPRKKSLQITRKLLGLTGKADKADLSPSQTQMSGSQTPEIKKTWNPFWKTKTGPAASVEPSSISEEPSSFSQEAAARIGRKLI